MTSNVRLGLSVAVAFFFAIPLTLAQVNVTTYHNDISRSGQNIQETTLTTSIVNYSSFGKLFAVTVDGQIYAQPLYLSNVSIGGGTHNVVYVVTENDTVYALDANTGLQYWSLNLGTPVSSGSSGINCNNISPQYGITSTPVIDLSAKPAPLLYVVALNGSSYQLHAISVETGLEPLGGGVNIEGSYAGITFDTGDQHIRPALLLENGNIIFGSGSHCDNNSWYGWVFSYSASTLQQNGIYNVEPSGHCAGIWMSGNGIAADSSGYLYLATGNSDQYLAPNYGDSILKLALAPNVNSPASAFSVPDYFTPFDATFYGNNDEDVGAGGVLLLPNAPRLVEIGKAGALYLINTTTGSMGKFCSNCGPGDTNIVQELPTAAAGLWGSPAYWNGYVYFGSAGESLPDTMKSYTYNPNSTPELAASTTTPTSFTWPSPTPSVSSNGTSNGIVWALDNSGAVSSAAILHAYQATNLSNELYNSNQIPTRDAGGGPIKFTVPTIANGKVYVGGAGPLGTNGQLTVYGQVSPTATLAPSSAGWSGNSNVNNSVYYPFTLSNATKSTITISAINVSGEFWNNTSKTTCGATLAPLASCTISVGFNAYDLASGTYTGTLSVTDTAPNSPQTANLRALVSCRPCNP